MSKFINLHWPRTLQWLGTLGLAITLTHGVPVQAQTYTDDHPALQPVPQGRFDTSDEALVKRLPGFRNAYATANGVRLHYVIGGSGPPLVLLPGHPETWWGYHKMMPLLARDHTVIVVDIRGMGTSEVTRGGYDKKTMQEDVYQLVRQLGHARVGIVGHDIGAMVAFSFAANHPEAAEKVVLLDVPHPDDSWLTFPMLPAEGSFGSKVDAQHPPYPWWFAFHNVGPLAERLLAGNGMRDYIANLYTYLSYDNASIAPLDLAVFGDRYSSQDRIRAGHAWYRAWPQDIRERRAYAPVTMPVLGLGATHTGFQWLRIMEKQAMNFRLVEVKNSGHFIALEQPVFAAEQIQRFLRE
jgi:pimeloyl-ACP methyl ester carboxylesterase